MHNALSLRFEKASSFKQPKQRHWTVFVLVALFLNLFKLLLYLHEHREGTEKARLSILLASFVV